ncbi:MAG: hypothetical protein HQM08_13845 [Candidatus Riflebacteria bacterium]|nr:hypothetical protein [Candidatus Riflebacteria bacterium]
MDAKILELLNALRRSYTDPLKTPVQRLRERWERIFRGRELLKSKDPRSSVLVHFEKHGYYLVNDRLIQRDPELETKIDWIHVNSIRNKKCSLWHNAIFDTFGYIPSPCYECFKVVVKPRTVKELFVLYELSRGLRMSSKCGIERREFVFGPYSMFFYASGLKEGLRIYREVREVVHNSVSPDVSVILKCGCTRYELEMGPSDQWKMSPEQTDFESFLKENISKQIWDWEMEEFSQNEKLQDVIKKTWISWAYHIGDSTYLEFTEGRPVFPKGATYHDKGL